MTSREQIGKSDNKAEKIHELWERRKRLLVDLGLVEEELQRLGVSGEDLRRWEKDPDLNQS